MLEDKGWWIVGEALRHDEDMAKVVIRYMANVSQGTSNDGLNRFRIQYGEMLPLNMERTFSRFMVRKEAVAFKVDSQKLLTFIALLREQLLITKFVGPKPNAQTLENRFQTLNHKLEGNPLYFWINVERANSS